MKPKLSLFRQLFLFLFAIFLITSESHSQSGISAGKLSLFGGGGGSMTFGRLYDRARYGAHGVVGATVLLAPGNSEAFELVGSATASLFPNDGKIGGDFLIATGGLELRLVTHLDKPVRYFFGLGGGVARVREKFFESKETGKMVDGFVEWGPYFAPGIGFDSPVGRHLRLFTQAHFVMIFGNNIDTYQYLRLILGLRL